MSGSAATDRAASLPAGAPAGARGIWLRDGDLAAFVANKPHPRVLFFGPADGASMLAPYQGHEYYGIRSWFMEPEQTPVSGLPALVPSRLTRLAMSAARVDTGKEQVSGLSLGMTCVLEDKALQITHRFVNETNRTRRLAPWAITAVAPSAGWGVVPWPAGPRRVLVINAEARVTDPILHHSEPGLVLDFAAMPDAPFIKVGLDADCGWLACVGPDAGLRSEVAHQPGCHYPEGGGTVTMFRSGPMDGAEFAEIENVGPLQTLAPGEAMELHQKLTLRPGLDGMGPSAWLALQEPE
ncbi:hypothetical protein ACMU_12185 [Actibacterium mucosum KCTC 23349]|uniref:Uncharacterized protein n=1 Tax=Actibacterium mucosum KCTC 23349 TaxID=1454373 RepID=A0A037ZIK9_9RHOB|nr:hypothetical protein [Actibacterium mucosum]KAJ55449.1 hypothetical protein ACMU_12185 [Actibacterium mucosum KCTC 23349]